MTNKTDAIFSFLVVNVIRSKFLLHLIAMEFLKVAPYVSGKILVK